MATPRKTWIFFVVGAVPIVGLLGMTVFVFSKAIRDMGTRDGGARATEMCVSRLGKVAKAQLLYAEDHDGRLPPAEFWVDATWPYAAKKDPEEEGESVFRCPVISIQRRGEYGYAFNAALDAQPLPPASDRPLELVFDSKALFRNAAGPPVAAYPGPEGRHNDGTDLVVAFVDGSVKVIPR